MSHDDAAHRRLRSLLERFVADRAELDAVFAGAPLLATLSIDSITLVHIVMTLEKEYSVRFELDSMDAAFADITSLLAFLGAASGKSQE
jgi:acyl carrier protein